MRHAILSLIAFVLVTSTTAIAQENKAPEQKLATTPESEKPKTEVERMLEEIKKRGETILAACASEPCSSEESGVKNGRVIRLPQPAYPGIARMAKAEGEVKVQIIIGEDGTVIAAAAVSGHPLLYGVSVATARETTFTPTLLHDKPVKVVGVLTYNFVSQ